MRKELSTVLNFAGVTYRHGDHVTVCYTPVHRVFRALNIVTEFKTVIGTIIQIDDKEIVLMDTLNSTDYNHDVEFIRINDIVRIYVTPLIMLNPVTNFITRISANYKNKKMLRHMYKEEYKKKKYKQKDTTIK